MAEELFKTTIDGYRYETHAASREEGMTKMENHHREQVTSGKIRPEGVDLEALEQSGISEALLSGLSNDETMRIRWLAEKRFPEIVAAGGDPLDYYFTDKDGDISYKDPYEPDDSPNRWKKEFSESIFGLDAYDVFGKVAPTGQFLAELVPGVVLAIAGGATAGIPGVMIGGSTGTAAGGGAAYAARQGLTELLDGPPMNVEKATKDLMLNTAFGAIPFGAPAKGFPQFMQGMVSKFPGAEGKTALREILEHGGSSVDDKIAFAQQKYKIDLTRGEADQLVSNASQIQKYLQVQPNSQKLWDFYHNRAAQVERVAQDFFDEVLHGRYARKGVKDKLTGQGSLDAPMDVAEAAENFLKRAAEKRKERATSVYKGAWELDTPVDVGDILTEITEKLADKNVKGPYRNALEKMKASLTDQNAGFDVVDDVTGKTVKQFPPKTDIQMLHDSLSQDFRPLIEGLTKDNQKFLKAEVSNIRGRLSERMKLANPEYARATAIYDPSKGHLQWLERSIVKQLATAVEKGGAQAGRMTQRLFSGQVSPREVRRLRRIIQAEDPQAWQNLKGTWLMTQFDDAVAGSINPLGAPNKFLSRLGIRGRPFQRVMEETAGLPSAVRNQARSEALRARGRKAQVLKEMFDPDELDNFVDLTDMMQAVSFISTQSQSPTQTLRAMQQLMEQEGKSVGSKLGGLVTGIVTIPQRLLVRGFDDIGENILRNQKEAYEDYLIDAMIDPKKAQELRTALDSLNKPMYYWTQTLLRGGADALEALLTTKAESAGQLQEQRDAGTFEEQRAAEEAESTRQQLGSDLDSAAAPAPVTMPQIPLGAGPMPDFDAALSPTIVPSQSDREIAERLRAQQGGIGSLG